MARKVVNRKELREEVEAAERAGITKKPKAARAPTKRKSRSKVPVEVRKKMFWGVFNVNQPGKPVVLFEFDQKDAADKKAASLSQSGKTLHDVRKWKQIIEEP